MTIEDKGNDTPALILDASATAQEGERMLGQALDEGLRRGLITRAELRAARGREGLSPGLKELLERT